jgi:hypothetical protein
VGVVGGDGIGSLYALRNGCCLRRVFLADLCLQAPVEVLGRLGMCIGFGEVLGVGDSLLDSLVEVVFILGRVPLRVIHL